MLLDSWCLSGKMTTAVLTNVYLIFALLFTVCLCKLENYRLPKNVIPVRYYLTIQPDLENKTFNGSVVIDIVALENSNNITLHQQALEINSTSISVLNSDGGEVKVVNTTQDEVHQTYTINTKNQLIKGRQYRLAIGSFKRNLKQKSYGFFFDRYYDKEGNERKFALTDFEPLEARQTFPCFDEPALKANFIINIIRPREYISASNEELESTIDLGNDLYQDIYKETPKMSTCTVSLTVFDLDFRNISKTITVYGRPEAIKDDMFSYSGEYSVKILQAIENFTGINYPLNKLNLIPVPGGGFSTRAMENWGSANFREESLAFSNCSSAIQNNLGTIAHELSHMWFGNLVSPAWWDSMWLSEAFAAYFRYYFVNEIEPSWRYLEQIVLTFQTYFRSDSMGLEEHNKISSNFIEFSYGRLTILYGKGAIVVRMMEHFLTHDIFKNGLRIFLNRHKFGVAQTEDMYDALQTAVNDANANHLLGNLTVAEILDTWVNRTGFPIVTVTRNYTTGSTTFTQKKRIPEPYENKEEDVEPVLYHVPINYVFQSDAPEKMLKTSADFWLSSNNMTVNNLTTSGWMLVNIQLTGFYRVNYDIQNWERIIDFMRFGNFEEIPPANRAQLINDAFYLAQSKIIPYSIAFNLCKYLVRERDYIPIRGFLDHKHFIESYFKNLLERHKHNEINEILNYTITYTEPIGYISTELTESYFLYTLKEIYNHLGVTEKRTDSHLDRIMRAKVLQEICFLLDDCREDLKAEFRKIRTYGIDSVMPNMQFLVFCEGAKTESGKNYLLHLFDQVSDLIKHKIKLGLDCYQLQTRSIVSKYVGD